MIDGQYVDMNGKETKKAAVVDKFKELTSRDDVGILLINQNVRLKVHVLENSDAVSSLMLKKDVVLTSYA